MAEVEGRNYDDSNRAFLQAFLARNVLTLENAKPILASIFTIRSGEEFRPENITQDDFNSYISAANDAISPLDLEIRSTFHQKTRERFYALVNTTSDPLTQLATTYTADEIVFLKRMLDAMFDGPANRGKKEAMCLSAMEAIQVGRNTGRRETQNGTSQSAFQGLSVRDSENMLDKLLQEGWLEQTSKKFYTLSPRALMELKGWLVDAYNEVGEDEDEDDDTSRQQKIKFCYACKDIITMGQRCPRPECRCRLHDICTQNFFRMQRSETCPICKIVWDGKSYVGEKAKLASEPSQKHKQGGKNARQQQEVEGETNGDGDG